LQTSQPEQKSSKERGLAGLMSDERIGGRAMMLV